MDAESQEAFLKKKLKNFLHDLQHFGTVPGFKHFSCYIRGREELIIKIKNTLVGSSSSYSSNLSAPPSRKQSICYSDSLTSSHLPYDKGSLVLSQKTQVGLSGLHDKGVGLPPASPSEQECTPDDDVTLFLIAGYARYSCPYVWVRSNHERLLKLSGDRDLDKDSPLRLKSTAWWKDGDVRVIDIVAELVKLCTYPAPLNPFEVDLEYFDYLQPADKLLASASMVTYLQKIVMFTPDTKQYAGKVFDDLHHMAKFHFECLKDISVAKSIPVLQIKNQPKQQSQKQEPNPHQHPRKKRVQKQTSTGSTRQTPKQTSSAPPSHPNPPSHQPPVPPAAQYPQFNAPPSYGYPNPASTQPYSPAPNTASGFPPSHYPNVMQPMSVPQHSYPSMSAHTSSPFYGQGNTYNHGGFDRMPAPSLF